ncbi:MAG: hypothetical protein ABJQ70_01590 [Roseobacter sp.]
MTKTVDPLSDFDDLRRVAIEYSQQASGEIWTDYNIHDPGVTLLEQTCFALSQIAYQVGLPTRDLLTNPRGHFCAQDLALFKPRKVLSTNPVTRDDLAAWFCACPQIESVAIAPAGSDRPNHYDITVVPSDDTCTPEHIRDVFETARPLCTALGRVALATPIDVVLSGEVEIGSETLPETVAAALYHKIAHILTGSNQMEHPALRADVWSNPMRLLAPAQSHGQVSLDLSKHLAEIRSLPGIRDIADLSLQPTTLGNIPTSDTPIYYHIVLPDTDEELNAEPGLRLLLNGAPSNLSATRLKEEFMRVSAETIAEASHHIDKLDWDVMRPGRNRKFTHAHVDSLLPQLFRAQGYRMYDPHTLVAEYRSAIDDVLRDMVDELNALPHTFAASAHLSQDDPVLHRLRVDLLDYLIALQGVEMPTTRHSGLHTYRTTRARHRFDIEWRLEYLFALPGLHRGRATGPGPNAPGGFLAELALLCDLGLSRTGDMTQPLRDFGLTLDDTAEFVDAPDAEELLLIPAHSPFDMLVPEVEDAALLSKDDLAQYSPFLNDLTLNPAMLAHLTKSDRFAISPHIGGRWLILFDPGTDAALRQIGIGETKGEALEIVTRLRATWRHINRASETAHLVEHVVHLESSTTDPNVADLILPGWTARCQMESFRRYVETRVLDLAPAHVHVRVHWLSFEQMQTFESNLAAESTDGWNGQMLQHLDSLVQTGSF